MFGSPKGEYYCRLLKPLLLPKVHAARTRTMAPKAHQTQL